MLYVKSSRLIENTNLNETQNNQCGTLTQLLYRKCFKLHSKVLFILITTCVFLAYVIFANLHIICIGKINDLNKKLIAYHHSWSTGRVFILKHFASKYMHICRYRLTGCIGRPLRLRDYQMNSSQILYVGIKIQIPLI